MRSHRSTPLVALRAFEVAARRLSFAEAASELHVTPAAVSHQIRRLEEYLDLPLFQRLNRSIALTDAGAALAARLHEIFSQLDAALVLTSDRAQTLIQVSALPSLAAKWLAPRLHRFETAFPEWKVRISTSDHLVNFDYETIDVALRYGAGAYPRVHAEQLMAADAFPVCSPALLAAGPPLKKPADLRRYILLHDESSEKAAGIPNWRSWLAAAGATSVKSDRGPVFGGIHLALEAALAGHGFALGLAPLVESDLRNGRLVRPFGLAQRNAFSFWVVCPLGRADIPKVKAFRRWLRTEAAARF